MPAYIPPHLRKKMTLTVTNKRGVKWPSNAHGDPSADVKYKKAPTHFRNGNLTRSNKYRSISRNLGTRKIRVKPLKGLLKGKSKTMKAKSL